MSKKEKTIKLPCFGIEVYLTGDGGGSITSDLHKYTSTNGMNTLDYDQSYNDAIDGLESLILAHACAGVNIESPDYIEGIETAVEAISNNT